MKKVTSMAIGLIVSFVAFSQSFEQTMLQADVDFNHYSVETTSTGDYIVVGTKFYTTGIYNNIHIFKMDANGAVLWEQEINYSDDDRGLDVVEDMFGDFALCGYTYINGAFRPYIAKFDAAGTFLGDFIVNSLPQGAATNIIYSASNNAYVVGGFESSNFANPLINNSAFVLEVDIPLSAINWFRFLSGANDEDASVNDIVELSNGFFITGSIDYFAGNGYSQGVLAAFVDFFGFTVADLSFSSSNALHNGVSAVWDSGTDELFLMSNNSVMHTPQITVISLASSTSPTIVNHYMLNLDPDPQGWNPAGFELRFSLANPSNLMACGYFQQHGFTGDASVDIHATPWLTEFDRYNGNHVATLLLDLPSPNFALHGGNLFSTFTSQQPYIFNQEILTYRPDGNGYMFLGPHQIAGTTNYSLEMVSTTFTPNGVQCLLDHTWDPSINNAGSIEFSDLDLIPLGQNPGLPVTQVSTPLAQNCIVAFKDDESDELEVSGGTGTVYPNPFTNILQYRLHGAVSNATVTVINYLGEVVYRQSSISGTDLLLELDLADQAAGIYLIQLEVEDNAATAEKVMKQ